MTTLVERIGVLLESCDAETAPLFTADQLSARLCDLPDGTAIASGRPACGDA